MEILRLFVAIELPPDVRSALAETQLALQRSDPAAARLVKWVDVSSIHLTLKFLGDAPDTSLGALRSALARAAAGRPSLVLSLGQAGCFPNARQPRVLWVGVAGENERLASLQQAVEAQIAPLGFPTESRRFSPHLTLGRVRDDADAAARQRLGSALQSARVAPASFVASSISLMRSELRPSGAVYTRLAEAALPGA
jgi:2'-5' RNA ligase